MGYSLVVDMIVVTCELNILISICSRANWRLGSRQEQPPVEIYSKRVQPRVQVHHWRRVCNKKHTGSYAAQVLRSIGQSFSHTAHVKKILYSNCIHRSMEKRLKLRFGTLLVRRGTGPSRQRKYFAIRTTLLLLNLC